jgi:hypothetical protein
MLYYNSIFKNSAEFAEKFGTKNGRRDKLPIAILKSPIFLKYLKEMTMDNEHASVCGGIKMWNAQNLWDNCMDILCRHYPDGDYSVISLNKGAILSARSTTMRLDEQKGICLDGDFRSIRYAKEVETQNGTEVKTYKIKAGKFLRRIIEENNMIGLFSEPIVVYLCEEFARKWEAYSAPICDDTRYKLVVNDDFERIYDKYQYVGNETMNSCMQNEGQHSFYEDAVDAKAAYLEDTQNDNKIAARAIIFTDVKDCETGEHLRLCERQYSVGCNDLLKRMLVNKLIAAGEIDGYKKVGADCHSARAFLSVKDEDWSERSFKIDCRLEYDDILSYQDSFKYFDYSEQVAYNDEDYGYDEELSTTDRTLNGGYYDEYHEEYCDEVTSCYYHGRWIDVDSERLEDFCYCECEEEYYHDDDCIYIDGNYYPTDSDKIAQCDECGEYYLVDEGCHSEITGEDYCCKACREEAEYEYKEEHWYYSEITEEYYEYELEMEEAEHEYQKENWYLAFDGEYYEYKCEADAVEMGLLVECYGL